MFLDDADPWIAKPWGEAGIGPIKWLDLNFASFCLQREEIISRSVPADAKCIDGQGFYFLIVGDMIVYVGISNEIWFRMRRHREDPSKYFTRVTIINAPEIVAKQMEAFYYEKYSPPFNERPERLHDALRKHLKK